jgi:hypothetical protein
MTDAVELFIGDLKCELQRFEPKPGNFFVLTFPLVVSPEEVERIQSQWKELSPYKLAIVGGGRIEMAECREPKS